MAAEYRELVTALFDLLEARLEKDIAALPLVHGHVRVEDVDRIWAEHSQLLGRLFAQLIERVARVHPDAAEHLRRELEPCRELLKKRVLETLRPH